MVDDGGKTIHRLARFLNLSKQINSLMAFENEGWQHVTSVRQSAIVLKQNEEEGSA